jgi:hypothetical protein
MAVVLAAAPYSAHAARTLMGSAVRSGRAAPAGLAAAAASGQVITGGSVGIPWTPQWSSKSPGTTTADGDTWFNTWADDGNIYATSDDSVGFNTTCRNNFVVNELTGNDPSQLASPFTNCMTGYGGEGARQNYHDGRTWKTDGVISVDGTLYVVVARQVDGYGGYPVGYQSSTDASIIKSTDHGRTWSNGFGTTSDPGGAPPPPNASGTGAEAMFPGSSFATPVFINYGQDDNPASTADGGDQYVYAISNDGWAYDGNYMMLGRVLRSKIGDLNAADWQYYSGPADGDGTRSANWSSNVSKATRIISAAHQLGQSGVQYIQGLHKYILTSFYFPFNTQWPNGGQSAHVTWSFYQAPHPWGPWTTFYSAPTVQCFNSCDPASASPIGLYDPVPASKFVNMNGLSDVIFSSGDWESRNRPNDVLYKLHAFPFTLTTTAGHVADDFGASYTGTWSANYQQGGYYDDTIHDSSTPGASASYTFTGNAIAWAGGRNANHGYASVSVDGGPPTLVNTYAPHQEKQQVLFAENDLSSGKHTITITVTSEKEAAATGTHTDIDAFIVGDSGQSAPIQVSPATPYMGAWPDSAMLAPGASVKETIELNNAGGATPLTASWNASVPGGAVTVSPASGTLTAAAGQAGTTTVTLSAPQNAPQTVATMTVSTTASNGSPVIPASLPVTVAPPGSIVRAYNDVGIVNDSSPLTSGGFDGSGTSYSAQALAAGGLTPGATVTHDGVTFTWPNAPAGLPDNVITGGQTITVSGSGSTLGFLGATSNGGASGTGTIAYTDGSTQQFTLAMSDWWSNAPPPGGDILASFPSIVSASGPETQKVSIYYDGVALQPGKTVQSITLPNVSNMHVFAAAIG